MEGAPTGDAGRVDARSAEAVSASGAGRREPAARRGDGGVRGPLERSRRRTNTPRARGRRPVTRPGLGRGSRARGSKLSACRQARAHPGPDRREAVGRRGRRALPVSAGRVDGVFGLPRREPWSTGIGRSSGCTCRASVAEVGERHLPHRIESGREAWRDGVGERGAATGSLTRTGPAASRRRVPGALERADRERERVDLGRRDRGIEPMEGAPGPRALRPNQAGSVEVLAGWWCRVALRKTGSVAASASERARVSAIRRQGASEVVACGGALSAEGRRGSVANASGTASRRMPRRTTGGRSCRG